MNGQPETEQFQNFDERLNHWISDQGFWFQLRYSLSGGGVKGSLTFHLLKLLARVGVFLAILAAGGWYYLATVTDSDGYRADLSKSLQEKFGAKEIGVEGFIRQHGHFNISRLAMLGGGDTFFTGLELRNLKCEMGLFDIFREEWDPGLIEINRADVSIHAGADSEAASKAIADVLFQDFGRVKIDSITVADTSIRWGYSKGTRGEISGSKMRALRIGEGWRLIFRGGTFTQNWLKKLDIEELDVVLSEQGIVFEKAKFKKLKGEVIFTDLKVEAGQKPKVSGIMELRQMDLALLIPPAAREFVEGRVSGKFNVIGSTNSSEGVGFDGVINLAGEEVIVVRDRIPLLRALSVIDSMNNYRRVDFTAGNLGVKTHAGNVIIRDVDLSAQDLMTLKGGMLVRAPTSKEALEISEKEDLSKAILTDDELELSADDFTLKEAAAKSALAEVISFDEEKGGLLATQSSQSENDSLAEKIGIGVESRRIDEYAAERLSRSYRYEGNFTISIGKDSFARAPKMAELYPASGATGRIFLNVPINGSLFDLTQDQADQVYKDGAR